MQLHPQEFIKIDFHFETMKLKPNTVSAGIRKPCGITFLFKILYLSEKSCIFAKSND